jgi:hypothetical protein
MSAGLPAAPSPSVRRTARRRGSPRSPIWTRCSRGTQASAVYLHERADVVTAAQLYMETAAYRRKTSPSATTSCCGRPPSATTSPAKVAECAPQGLGAIFHLEAAARPGTTRTCERSAYHASGSGCVGIPTWCSPVLTALVTPWMWIASRPVLGNRLAHVVVFAGRARNAEVGTIRGG